jgi:ubiquitin carboxyl-terminal hydrolase 4/11/15
MEGNTNDPPVHTGDEMELDKTVENGNKAEGSGTPSSANESSGAAAGSSSPTEVDEEVLPSIDEQVELVKAQTAKLEEKEGMLAYVISRNWLGRVVSRSKYASEMGAFDKSCVEGDIGRVNNNDIIVQDEHLHLVDEKGLEFVPLRKGLSSSAEFELVPESSWDQIVKWYGLEARQKPVIRYQHQTNPGGDIPEFIFEMYPPVFTLRKYYKKDKPDSVLQAPKILASRFKKYMDFVKTIKEKLGIPLTTTITIYRVLEVQGTADPSQVESHSMPTPEASREHTPNSGSDSRWIGPEEYDDLFSKSQIDQLDVNDESMNSNYNGSVRLQTLGLTVDQTLIIVEGPPKVKATKKIAPKNLAAAKESISEASSGRASPLGMITRGRNRHSTRPKGTVGLTNLGNTCYMNSALQCIRACKELSLFFLSNQWKKDLNPENPLGHKGQIASSYADLLRAIYSGGAGPFTPRQFKSTLGRFAPLFSGYGQQDSQEFMSFLVDGLHEDLNRIRQKPYTSNPDFDDSKIDDPEAIKELGEIYKKNYQARNSSVVTDLFNGFYKNKLVCPVCHKVSITFDPYLLLTLQLPMDHYWSFPFVFVPIDNKPVKIVIDNEKGMSMKALKEFVASRIPGTAAEKMFMAEIFNNKFYRVMRDQESIAEANIQQRDDMVIYQLEDTPNNWPLRKPKSMLEVDAKPDADTEEHGKQLVTVLHRVKSKGGYHSTNFNVVLWPNVIMLSKDEACDYNEILRKCLRVVQNTTERPSLADYAAQKARDLEKEDSDMESPAAEDTQSNEDDAVSMDDESPDGNVKTRSLSSEDGIVDVEMTGTEETERDPPVSKAPSWMQKGAEIPEALTDLFTIGVGYYSGIVPAGFQGNFDINGNYPSIRDRIPRPALESDESEKTADSPETADASDESGAEETPDRSEAEVSYYQSEGGEELSSITVKPGSGRNRKKKQKQKQKHQQKLAKRAAGKRSTTSIPLPVVDSEDARLVRPNEVIVLDWDLTAYSDLFDSPFGDSRKKPFVVPDPTLEKKAAARDAKRKRAVTLQDCFEETSKEEILSQENAWYCDRCKEHRLASKQLEIWTIPDILVIHLKRFSASRNFRDKIDILIDFPKEGLDLTGKVGVSEGKELIYDLFGVDNHYGGLGGGHYTAFAQNFYDGEWYEYNGKLPL